MRKFHIPHSTFHIPQFLVQWIASSNQIIGTETSRVYGEMVTGKPGALITDLSAELAKKIVADVAQKGGTLTARVESHADRAAKIKQQLEGKTEHIAAKTALQNGADALAERVIPKLGK